MAAAVTVLTPNGRRQTVKVSPNTPLLQVLEDVCKKHEFNPDDHGLKFQRNVLDLTLQWRYASLPNNAKLEMVAGARKQTAADGQVRIGLQMEDGSRLQGTFSSGQNLWELLTHFPETRALARSGATPVCVYMRDQVTGAEALQTATLRSLGLSSGSAVVRFLLKDTKTDEDEDGGREGMKGSRPPPSQRSDGPAPSQPHAPASGASLRTASPDRPAAAVEDGETAGPSGLASPPPPAAPFTPFTPFTGGGQRLGGPAAGGAGPLSSSGVSKATGGSPKAKKAKPCQNANAKGRVNQSDEDMELREGLLEPVEREALVYSLDSGPQRPGAHHELSDEFFEVTVDDIRKRFAQLKSDRRSLEETPLMTKALKESQLKEKMERYPKVVLRVQFPDRHVLQGFFRPLETVADVRRFVQNHLEDPELDFYLFVTPPKTVLDEASVTLFQAHLFPGALLYFGCELQTDCYLQREHLNACVSATQANEAIARCVGASSSHRAGRLCC
ncbi:unnamed protein product [Arctogadus glacialis]